MSTGFAAAEPATGTDPEQRIRRADEALYRAKEQGRDRVVMHSLGGKKVQLVESGSNGR